MLSQRRGADRKTKGKGHDGDFCHCMSVFFSCTTANIKARRLPLSPSVKSSPEPPYAGYSSITGTVQYFRKCVA